VTRNRILQYVAIGGGLAIVLGIAVAAFVSLRVPFDTAPTAGPSTGPCEPQPCANVRGYILWVSDLKSDGGLVTMQLRFQNSSSSTHADPSDISLLDNQKAGSAPVYDAPGCTHWPRTEFNNGASFGPVPECFRPASTSPPLGLRWTPDFGPFCCETVIGLD
jgi:hypothetical protein